MLENDLLQFSKQLSYQPKILDGPIDAVDKFVVCGMGGSQLPADIARWWRPELPLMGWRNYDIPKLSSQEGGQPLIIASSYSGNTEEALSAFDGAITAGLPVAAITSGGKLAVRAQEEGAPRVIIPDKSIQPRAAVGYSFLALLCALGKERLLGQAQSIAEDLDSRLAQKVGRDLANKLADKVPVVYASNSNKELAYQWKIALNETGKTPAFCNVFPEANHNELESFAHMEKDDHVPFHFILLRDNNDDPRIQTRMDVLAAQYRAKGLEVEEVDIYRHNRLAQAFYSLLLANWTGFAIAQNRDLDPEEVPAIEDFKRDTSK